MMQQPGAGGMPNQQPMAGQQLPPNMAAPPQVHPQQYQQPPYMMMMPQAPQSQPPPAAMWNNQQPQAPPPQQQQQQQQQQGQQPQQGLSGGSGDEVRTLWIGDLQYWMDENYLLSCFSQTGEVASVKVIRNKQSGQTEGYGFMEMISHAAAERILQTYNGTPMPNGEQNFRLNWASYGAGEKRDDGPEYTIFVGDLAADVTDYMLQETFRVHYPSVKGAKVVIDRLTGRTKGYGFVRFNDEGEQMRAMTEMNGAFCSSRPMRIGVASNKKTMAPRGMLLSSYQNSPTPKDNENDPNNTTIFVGNLDSNVTDENLRELFGQYGQLVHVKIPAGKRCGFVQYANRSSAEEALNRLNGAEVSGQSIRLSWGRNSSNKQWNGEAAAAGYYGYPQGYENYGYAQAPPPQDPSVYYGGYPGYANYQQQPNQQQQVGYRS
ncbi:Polyadenylate-binding protein RBP45B [Linum perenne]